MILRNHVAFWFKRAAFVALALGGTGYLLLAWFSHSRLFPVEWTCVIAAFAGPLASVDYRVAVWAPTLSKATLVAWAGSTLWGAAFFSLASFADGSLVQAPPPLLGRVLLLVGLGGLVSLMCLMPLKWLRASTGPQNAP